METKTKKAVELFKNGEYKQALVIFKTFRLGFSSDEKRMIEIASEVLCGNGKFYQSIGIDTDKVVNDSLNLIQLHYGNRFSVENQERL